MRWAGPTQAKNRGSFVTHRRLLCRDCGHVGLTSLGRGRGALPRRRGSSGWDWGAVAGCAGDGGSSSSSAPVGEAEWPAPAEDRPVVELAFDVADDLTRVTGTESVTFTPDLRVCELVFPRLVSLSVRTMLPFNGRAFPVLRGLHLTDDTGRGLEQGLRSVLPSAVLDRDGRVVSRKKSA